MQPQAFDTYAESYDEHFTNSLVGRAQRNQVYNCLLSEFKLHQLDVLEINCGTGEDANWLFKQSAHVTATDISDGMIKVAIAKAEKNKATIDFHVMKAQDINKLSNSNFELIFSNFGGLNCLNSEELVEFKLACIEKQSRTNKIALVIMGTNCFWERLFFWIKKDKVKFNRRRHKRGVDTIIDSVSFKTFYYSPTEIQKLFEDQYNPILVKPIGLFIPPSYLEPYIERRPLFFKLLRFLDVVFAQFSFFANKSDHYIIILEKK
jgi:SAM-dependent methyltransferase